MSSVPDPAATSLARVTALLYGATTALCVLGALVPMHAAVPRTALAVAAVLSAAATGSTAVLRDRLPLWLAGAYLGLGSAFIVWLAARSPDPEGRVVDGYVIPLVAIYLVWYFPRWVARVGAGLVVLAFALALARHGLVAAVGPSATLAASAVLGMEVIGRLRDRLTVQATTDPLTGALNRTGLGLAADREMRRAERTGRPLCLVMIDLDGFKQVNDTHGHAAGDELLVSLVEAWRGELRPYDSVARLGGDEFALLLPELGASALPVLADRLHGAHPAPWSWGGTQWQAGDDLVTMFARADAGVYERKRETHRP